MRQEDRLSEAGERSQIRAPNLSEFDTAQKPQTAGRRNVVEGPIRAARGRERPELRAAMQKSSVEVP
jgi:hypothetical protein